MCSRNCSWEECANYPVFACDCEAIPVLLCEKHFKIHSQLSRDHSYTKVFSEIQEETRKSAIKLFSKIKPELKRLRSNIIQEKLSTIKKVHNAAENAIKELKNYETNLNEIILEITNLKVIDYSKPLTFIESLLKQHPRNIEKNEKIRAPQLSIQNIGNNLFYEIFKLELATECFSYRKNYYDNSRIIKFVWKKSDLPVLGVFDAEHFKVYQHKLKWENQSWSSGVKCLLPDGCFIYSQDRDIFIIDPIGTIRQVYNCGRGRIRTAVYVGGCIFACFDHCCWMKYNIQKNNWSSLAYIPKNQGACDASALFRNYILLVSYNKKKVIFYDMIIDAFSEISSLNLAAKTNKTIVVHDWRVFIIEFSQFIYESTDNLMTWNAIGKSYNIHSQSFY